MGKGQYLWNWIIEDLNLLGKIRLASEKSWSGGINMVKKSLDIRKMTIIGVLGGISIMLGMTPLGFIPIGPTKATIMHIPVIIGAILEGPLVGAFVGLIFGIFSLIQAYTNPTPISFVFFNPIVSILPRILIGIVAYYSYSFIKKLGDKKSKVFIIAFIVTMVTYLAYGVYRSIVDSLGFLSIAINIILIGLTGFLAYTLLGKSKGKDLSVMVGAALGTFTNTFLVMGLIYLFYGEEFVRTIGGNTDLIGKAILSIALANGIPEMIIGVIVTTSVVGALKNRK